MRCYYCLKDEPDLPYEFKGLNKDGVPVVIAFHNECWKRVQQKVVDMICADELEFEEEEE